MSTPILVQPNQDKLFRLETDASDYATRVVLSQLCNNGKWHTGEEDNWDQVMLLAEHFHLSQAETWVNTSWQAPQPNE